MNSERYEQLKSIVDQVMDLSPDERQLEVERLCQQDDGLRQLVLSMLDHMEGSTVALEVAIPPLVEMSAAEQRIGAYRLLRMIGEGGMGAVYEAVRDDGGFEQRVALKVMRRGITSLEASWRFRLERQILAKLVHPHIAQLLDGGVTEQGLPFFTMEFVDGLPITTFSRLNELNLLQRIALLLQVARAVQFAHGNLLVHRDLKPANILVTKEGQVKLLDFGIAKVLGTQDDVPHTRTGVNPMTPQYASPEQYSGQSIGIASDIYSLGLICYEVLSGTPGHQFRDSSPGEIARVILQDVPQAPSRALEALPAKGSEPRVISAADLSGDLDAIVLCALRKEPERRYAGVQNMMEDLQAFLDSRPVQARGESLLYLTLTFIRRNRWMVAFAALLLLALLVITALSLRFVLATREQNRIISEERDRARQAGRFLVETFKGIDPKERAAGSFHPRSLLDRGFVRLTRDLADNPRLRLEMEGLLGEIYTAFGEHGRGQELLLRAMNDPQEGQFEGERRIALRLALASNYQEIGDWEEASRWIVAAQSLAREMALPTLQARVWTQSCSWAIQLSRFSQAEEALTAARSCLLGQKMEPDQEIELLKLEIALHRSRWEPARMDAPLQRLQVLVRQRWGEDSFNYVQVLDELSQWHTLNGRHAEALELLRQEREILLAILGERHLMQASVLGSFLNIHTELGQYEQALAYGKEAEKLYDQLLGPDSPEKMWVLNNLGYTYILMRDYDAAERELRRSLQLGQHVQANRQHHGNAYNLMCGLKRRQQKIPEAVEMGLRSFEIHRGAQDQQGDAAYSAALVTMPLLAADRAEEALPLMNFAVQFAREVGEPRLYPLDAFLIKQAQVGMALQRWQEAAAALEEAMELGLAASEPNEEQLDRNLQLLGECLQKLGRGAEIDAWRSRLERLRSSPP
jgi:serine/threonine-protein kinase